MITCDIQLTLPQIYLLDFTLALHRACVHVIVLLTLTTMFRYIFY